MMSQFLKYAFFFGSVATVHAYLLVKASKEDNEERIYLQTAQKNAWKSDNKSDREAKIMKREKK